MHSGTVSTSRCGRRGVWCPASVLVLVGLDDLAVGVLGSAYGLWLLYAAGLVYLLYTTIFYLVGLPFYIWARREQKAKVFNTAEWGLVALFAAMSVYAVYGLATGALSL